MNATATSGCFRARGSGWSWAPAVAVVFSLCVVSCGGRVTGEPRAGDDNNDGGPGGNNGASGGHTGSGGLIVQSTGGRATIGSGGRLAPGSGGRGAGGFVIGTGGTTTAAGGRPMMPPDIARLVPSICLQPCNGPEDCPSVAPYAGGCNGILHTCLITCELGCPPDTQSVSAAGGCFCYDPRVSVANPSNTCCSSYCGPPYNLPCCNGYTCTRGGKCCSGSTCL